MRQHGLLFSVAGAAFVQGLDGHQLARGVVARLHQPVHAGVGHQRGDGVAVDHLAHLQARRGGQHARRQQHVVIAACVQAAHTQHQRGGVVVAARSQRFAHQGFGCRLRTVGRAAQRADAPPRQRAVHAVAGEQQRVAHLQVALQIIHLHVLVQANGARQHAGVGLAGKGMVLRQLLAFIAAQKPGARIAHVRQRPAVTAQGQRGQRGQRRAGVSGPGPAPVVLCQPGVLGTDQAVQRNRGVPGGRRAEVVLHQRLHRGLRRHAAAAAAGDTVGQRRNPAQRLVARAGALHGREVFVAFAGPKVAGVADVDVKAHGADCHHGTALAIEPLSLENRA